MIETIKIIQDNDGYDLIEIIDQRLLPGELAFLHITTLEQMYEAIKTLAVRGAPALGVAGAYGLLLADRQKTLDQKQFIEAINKAAAYLKSSRPTAVNLAWAIDQCCELIKQSDQPYEDLRKHAISIHQDDLDMSRKIGALYKQVFPVKSPVSIMTICNAGGLATGGLGTALAPVFAACDDEIKMHVYCLETRPLLQGARLSAWELDNYDKGRGIIQTTILCDNMISSLFEDRKIDLIITGADRIAINGDSANKIGTHNLAIIAQYYNIPLYIAAPTSTIDFNCPDGGQIPIEQRDPGELTHFRDHQIAPLTVNVYNPAFDVTPANQITGFLTDRGLLNASEIKDIII